MTKAGETWVEKLESDCLGGKLSTPEFEAPVWTDAYEPSVAELWIRQFSKRVTDKVPELLNQYVSHYSPGTEPELHAVCLATAFQMVYTELIGCALEIIPAVKKKGN